MKVTLPILLLFCASCRTNEKKVTTSFVDGEQPQVRLNGRDEATVPTFMWSPSQRRAMAGFHFIVAEQSSLEGKPLEASKYYKSAYNLDPNPFLAAKLIRSHAGTGKLDDALPEAKKMVLLYPKSAELRLLYGQLLSSKGSYYPAVKELEKALEIGPPSELAYNELINLHLGSGLANRAIVVAEDYTKAFANSAEAWARLAQIYFTSDRQEKALLPAQRAYELQSLNPEYALLYAIVAEVNGDRKRAVSLYEQLYRLDPGNEKLIGRMISLYKKLGDLGDALALLDELSEISKGENPGVDIQKAFILWELKRFKEASVILERLAERFPEAERLQYMKALGYEKVNRVDEAIKVYEKIGATSAYYKEAQFRLMVSLKAADRLEEAQRVFDAVKTHKDVSWEFYVIGAGIKSGLGKNAEAAFDLKEGYKRFSDQPRLLFLAGVYYEKSGDLEASIATMKELISKDPTYSTAYNFIGYLYAEQGIHLDEAEALILKALKLKPGDGYYLDSLGWVFYQKKNYRKAEKYLLQAVEKLPEEGVVLEHLSDVYLMLGDRAKAFEYIKRAAAGALEDRDRTRVEEKFEKMKNERGVIN